MSAIKYTTYISGKFQRLTMFKKSTPRHNWLLWMGTLVFMTWTPHIHTTLIITSILCLQYITDQSAMCKHTNTLTTTTASRSITCPSCTSTITSVARELASTIDRAHSPRLSSTCVQSSEEYTPWLTFYIILCLWYWGLKLDIRNLGNDYLNTCIL